MGFKVCCYDNLDSFYGIDGKLVDLYSFFYAAITSQGVLTLDDLHTIIRDVWLTRHDTELEEERAARRKGRPKSVKEQKIEELKLREAEEYRTGLGELFRIYNVLRIIHRLTR